MVRPRRWLGPTTAAILAYAVIAGGLLMLPRQMAPMLERRVDVRFVDRLDYVESIAKPEPPPSPPAAPAPVVTPPTRSPAPRPETRPKLEPKAVAPRTERVKPAPKAPPAAAAPLVRPDQKVRRLEKPPPVRDLRAPRELPTERPKEAEPSQDKGVAVYGEPGPGDAAGLEGGATHGGVAGGTVGGAVDLPAGAQPPRLLPGAAVPSYPPAARAARKSGTVILKAIVYADGTVGDVRVVSGEEPFVAAALAAVKAWRYEPARLNGQPIAVYREIRIPFTLSG